MFNTKCGCPVCKSEKVPQTKWQWKSRKNKFGRTFGIGSGKFKTMKKKQ